MGFSSLFSCKPKGKATSDAHTPRDTADKAKRKLAPIRSLSSEWAKDEDLAQTPTSEMPNLGRQTTELPKLKPLIFALLRNGHEVIRGASEACALSIAANDTAQFAAQWADLSKWQKIHGVMEEGVEVSDSPLASILPGIDGLFAVLDENVVFLGYMEKNEHGLRASHTEIGLLERAVTEALGKAEDDETRESSIREAWSKFVAANEAHLKSEEEVMMPKVLEMTKNGVDLKSLMQVRIFPAALHHCKNDMTFFIGFAMQTLEKMENEESRDGEKGPPKVRVFVHALQAIGAVVSMA